MTVKIQTTPRKVKDRELYVEASGDSAPYIGVAVENDDCFEIIHKWSDGKNVAHDLMLNLKDIEGLHAILGKILSQAK